MALKLKAPEPAAKHGGAREAKEQVVNSNLSRDLANDPAVQVGEHRRPTKEEQANKGSNSENTTFNDLGRGAAYRAAKLKRDHPEIAERMAAGEFKSIAQAERAARGEPEPERMTPVYANWSDPATAAERIREKLGSPPQPPGVHFTHRPIDRVVQVREPTVIRRNRADPAAAIRKPRDRELLWSQSRLPAPESPTHRTPAVGPPGYRAQRHGR